MKIILENIDLLAIFQSLFLVVALLLKKQNRDANKVLSAIIIFVGIDVLEKFMISRGYFVNIPFYPWGSIHFIYMYAPAFYLCARLITGVDEHFEKKNLLHFIPLVLVMVLNSVFYYSIDFHNPEIIRELIFSHKLSFENIAFRFLEISYFIFYTSLALHVIVKYSQKIKHFYSNTAKISLRWLQLLLIFQIGVEVMLNIAYFSYQPGQTVNIFHVIASFLGLIILVTISIFMIVQPEILNKVEFSRIEADTSEETSYKKFRMGDKKEEELKNNLMSLMKSEKVFLDESINLKKLADMLGISIHQLSMLLSIHIKQNFFTFINTYRVEEAKILLTDPAYSEYNILRIAYEAGFNSKSAFNTVFKKIAGCTPTQFRNLEKIGQ